MSVNLTAENMNAAREAAKELREMAGQIISPRNSKAAASLRRMANGVEFAVRMAEMADDLAERLDRAQEDADGLRKVAALLIAKAGGEVIFTAGDMLRLGDGWTLESWENHNERGVTLRAREDG